MNYILRLQEEKKALEEQVERLSNRLLEFRWHLGLPKFNSPGNDYIQTQDVHNWLDYIQREE